MMSFPRYLMMKKINFIRKFSDKSTYSDQYLRQPKKHVHDLFVVIGGKT